VQRTIPAIGLVCAVTVCSGTRGCSAQPVVALPCHCCAVHCCKLRPVMLSCVVMLRCRSHTATAQGCVPLLLLRLAEACCTATAVYATPVPVTSYQGKDGAQAKTCPPSLGQSPRVVTLLVTHLCPLDFGKSTPVAPARPRHRTRPSNSPSPEHPNSLLVNRDSLWKFFSQPNHI
jgi:hypothetical protein